MKSGLSFCLVIILFITYLVGCSSSRKTTVESEPASSEPVLDESFDPLILDDEDITFSEEIIYPVKPEVESTITETKMALENSNVEIDGFRVQIFATKDIEAATIAKKEAEFAFIDDSVNIYIEFDSPYYKIRAGDYRDRENAENFRETARQKGYATSWIVKTKVWSNPPLEEIKDE